MDDLTWENIKEKYQVGTFIRGKVVQHMDFGIFLDISEPGVKGLIRIVDFVDEGEMREDLYPAIGSTVGGVIYGYSDRENGQINLSATPSAIGEFLLSIQNPAEQTQ
jgi:ribosomal protein S1